jgi:hypothetical protein
MDSIFEEEKTNNMEDYMGKRRDDKRLHHALLPV